MTPRKPMTPWQAQTLPELLPLHVRRNIEEGEGGCWLWTRSKSPDGYGWASLDNRTHQAHRLVFTLCKGEPPEGMVLDHLCRVRHCVNPAHLEPVTPAENLIRSAITPAGQAHCLKCGGEFGTIGVTVKQRRCLPCSAKYNEARRAAKAQYMRDRRRGMAA